MGIDDTVAAYVEAAGEFSHVVSAAMLRMARELTEVQEWGENLQSRVADLEAKVARLSDPHA